MPLDPYCYGICVGVCTVITEGIGAVLCIIGCGAACAGEVLESRNRFLFRLAPQEPANVG